ncbi:hypothetical protein M3Y95_01127200 [Aphelenchoides besseyi]|nr:hypothetical protein M3Y95_01127200 [Aphelenchoides besseyi]
MSLRPYRSVLLISGLCDSFILIVLGLCQMYSRQNNGLNLMVFMGPGQHFLLSVQWLLFSFMLIIASLEAGLVLFETIFRYQFLKLRHSLPLSRLLCQLSVMLGLVFVQVPVYYWMFAQQQHDYHSWWPQVDLKSNIVVMDFKNSFVFKCLAIYRVGLITGSFVLTIFFGWLSIRVMKREVVKMSKRTRVLLNQFSNTLIIRFSLYQSISLQARP